MCNVVQDMNGDWGPSPCLPAWQVELSLSVPGLLSPERRANIVSMSDTDIARIIIPACGAILWDVDGTMVESEPAFSGPDGAASLMLTELLARHGITFSPQDWEEHGFSQCCGRGPEGDSTQISQHLIELFGLDIPASEVLVALINSQREHWPSLLPNMEIISGAAELITDANSLSIRQIICTASSEYTAVPEVAKLGVLDCFADMLTDARKRFGDGYSHLAAQDACDLLGVDPAKCVLIGDSLSDIATAELAGINLVVIRAPFESRAALSEKIHAARARQYGQNEKGPNETTIVFISDFSQISWAVSTEQNLRYLVTRNGKS